MDDDEILKTIIEQNKNHDIPIDIERITEEYGMTIIKRDLGKIDGMLFDSYIGVNKKLSKAKQRFVIAHEFCHFLLGEKGFSKGIYHSSDLKEKRADNFATQILLPEDKVKELYEEYQNIPTIAGYFGVPCEVVVKRLNIMLSTL